MKHTTNTGMTYEVKKYSETKLYSGIAYSYDLWIDGKHVATIENRGDGGPTWDHWKPDTDAVKTKVEAYAVSLPPIPGDRPLPMNLECWYGLIADEFVNDRRLGRLCKTRTVYHVEGQQDGMWWVSSLPFTPANAAMLRAQNTGKKVEFYNERLS